MIQLEVWGKYACFSRPELKVERLSYDVPTPSAARGIIEAIYYHPGLKWSVDKIYVLNEIQFTNIRRNELKSKIPASNVRSVMNGSSHELYIAAFQDIAQRASTVLQDGAWSAASATIRLIWAAGNSPPISAGGQAAKFLPSQRRGIWGSCYMIWIIMTLQISSQCFSAPGWKTASSTQRIARCYDDSASINTPL